MQKFEKNLYENKGSQCPPGASLKKCKYYDEMDEIYGRSHVMPIVVASNLCQRDISTTEDEEIKEIKEINEGRKKNENLQLWKYIEEKLEKSEEARERRHKENMEQQKEALATYKEFMSKSLEKL